MFKKFFRIREAITKIHDIVEYSIEKYNPILQKINSINLSQLDNLELKEISNIIKRKAVQGIPLDDLLVQAFSLVREVSKRQIGLYPYDVQVVAGIAMHEGKLVEMNTGEGKTLAAVLPVYLNALTGKGVHVLIFNDYLAHRDAEWMKPIYEFLGLTVGHVIEGMSRSERQRAYNADITYVTAKEAGFDYLRDFLCTEDKNLVQRNNLVDSAVSGAAFNFAIIDEADSLLIDEARMPLVIAGSTNEKEVNKSELAQLVRNLSSGEDYEIEHYGSNVYLTDIGLDKVERMLQCGNLYDEQNLELLTSINCALYAEALLLRDKDYIVKNSRVEIIDEFTGRIADKRKWPDGIHEAVEAKENIFMEFKGEIMGSIALQYFFELYPKLAGMTGTARTIANELKEFYGMNVLVIPPNKPCIRKDHADALFADRITKENSIFKEIERVHGTGQPILIGTSSVEESERLAIRLNTIGIRCNVLNAKNDEREAEIIAQAGRLGAVTVSTNMAGRGVDIKLGGSDERDKDIVVGLGGLYVLGTNFFESIRIENQLRGRAGRQGEPGESKFFISMEDELVKKYDLTQYMSSLKRIYPKDIESILNIDVLNELHRGRKIIEGYNADIRRQLWKYSYILEQQRRKIYNKRQGILKGRVELNLLSQRAAEKYNLFKRQFGEKIINKIEKQISLYYINKNWAQYLNYISYIRESIHLVVVGNKNPLDEFNSIAMSAYLDMINNIDEEIVKKFLDLSCKSVTKNGIEMEIEGLSMPSSTWTYLVTDSPDQFSKLPALIKSITKAVSGREIKNWI